MAYDQNLANRIANKLYEKGANFIEKRMFGGIAFMINDKMCVGVVKDEMMLRVLDEHCENLLELPHFRAMEFTGKPMKGFLFIDHHGLEKVSEFEKAIDLAIEFGEKGVVKTKKTKK
jgi:TfoX/Sxy family transcriptional regulator of competence genes